MRTIKQFIEEEEQLDEITLFLENGDDVTGFWVEERLDRNEDTDGYHIYDVRSGEENGVEIYRSTIEKNLVMVDWSGSLITKEEIDFGDDYYLEIDNKDIIDYETETFSLEITGLKRWAFEDDMEDIAESLRLGYTNGETESGTKWIAKVEA